jgi:hypothetical protein
MTEWRPTLYANAIPVLAQEENVVAINGSIEVDLTGQIVSESRRKPDADGNGRPVGLRRGRLLVEGRPSHQPGPVNDPE